MEYFYNHPDKWFHLIIGAMFMLWILVAKRKKYVWIGFGLCVLIAAAKELVFDLKLGKGSAELLDFVFTMILPAIVLIIKLRK